MHAYFFDYPVSVAAFACFTISARFMPPQKVGKGIQEVEIYSFFFNISHSILSCHPEPNMRLRNSSMDGSDGSQLFEDTSGAGPGSQSGYRWEPCQILNC